MDLVARETGVDPVEVRRKNFVRVEDQPFTTLLGLTYDSGDYRITLDRALQMVDYEGLRREEAEKRKQGKYLGIGLSTYIRSEERRVGEEGMFGGEVGYSEC